MSDDDRDHDELQRLRLARWLVEGRGADPAVRDRLRGETPGEAAARVGKRALAAYLTPLALAAEAEAAAAAAAAAAGEEEERRAREEEEEAAMAAAAAAAAAAAEAEAAAAAALAVSQGIGGGACVWCDMQRYD